MRPGIILFLGLLFGNAFGQRIVPSGDTTFCTGDSVILRVSPDTGITAYQWLLGSSGIATTNSYTAKSSGSYRLKITRRAGGDTTIGPVTVTVNQNPRITVNSASICSGQSTILTATGANSYVWAPGTGLSSTTGESVTATPVATTMYTVTGTNLSGCSGSAISTVTIVPFPARPAFTVTTDGQCAGLPFNFTITSAVAGVTYSWDFGDGTTASGATANHVFNAIGNATQTYTVKVTATVSPGCSTESDTRVITVKQRPDPNLFDPNNFRFCGNIGDATLNVTDISAPVTNTTYEINWGDNSSNYLSGTKPENISHTYSTGIYSLTYKITGTNGCIASNVINVLNITNPRVGAGIPANASGCGPLTICFPINEFESNHSSTIYKVNFGDGSPIRTFSQPPPDSVCHTYTKTSCGEAGARFNFEIQAINGCDTSYGNFSPIRVFTKPIAKFEVGPQPGCVNKPVPFTNTTIFGYNNLCSISAIYTWNFGDGSPVVTVIDNSPQTHVYQAAGTYQVTLTARNTCDTSNFTLPVCIEAQPVPSFNLSDSSGCIPLMVNVSNQTTISNSCENPIYSWTISRYTPAYCGTSSSWDFAPGSSDTSTNPSFTFNTPGIYTIEQKVTNACGEFLSTRTVHVKQPPKVSIALPPYPCGIVNITPVAVVEACTDSTPKYTWTFEGGSPAASDLADPGNITFTTPGHHLISLSVTNECGTITDTASVIVVPQPDVTATPDQSFCHGLTAGPFNFTNTIGIPEFNWTNNNPAIGLPANGSGNIPAFTVINNSDSPVTATIIVTPSEGSCIGIPDTFVITVNPKPGAPVVNTPVVYCQHAPAAPLAAVATGTNTLTWYTNDLLTGGTPVAPVPSTSLPGSTLYYVTQTNTFGCSSIAAVITVEVNASLSGNIVDSNQNICANTAPDPLTSGLLSGGSGTYLYQWQSLPQGSAAWQDIIGETGSSYSPGILSDTIQYRRIVSSGPCTDTSNVITINVAGALSNFNISASDTICEGAIPLLINGDLPEGGGGSYSYQWQSSADNTTWTNIPAATQQNYQPPALSVTTLYRRIVNTSQCTATSNAVIITVNPLPVASITSSGSSICAYDSSSIGITFTAGTTPFDIELTITKPGGATDTTRSTFDNNAPLPILVIPSMSLPGDYTMRLIKVTDNNGCENLNSGQGITIAVKPVPLLALTNSSPICSGAGATLTVSGADTYSWSPNAFINTTEGSAVVVTPPATTTYFVRGTLNGCFKDTSALVTVIPAATVADAGTDQTLCGATGITLAGNTPVIGTGKWTQTRGPEVAIFSDSTLPNTSVTGLVPGGYVFQWTITNGDCPPSMDTVQVVIDENVTAANAGPPQNKCGSTVTMAANMPTIGEGNWSIIDGPNVPVIADMTSNTTDINGLVPGNYVFRWTITNGSCSDSSDVSITISSGASPAVAGSDQNLCLDTSVTLSATPPAVGTGMWVQTAGPAATIVSPSSGTTIVNGLIPEKYVFRWVVTFSNCPVNVDSVQITVYDNPSIANAGSHQTLCASTTSFDATAPAVGAGTWNQIDGPNTAAITDAASPVSLVSALVPGTYRFKWTITNGPCATTQDTVIINVTEMPTTAEAGTAIRACAVSTITLSGNTPSIGTGKWTQVSGPAGALITDSTLKNTSVTGLVPDTYVFRWTITNGNCPPSSDTVQVIIDENVTAADAGPDQTKCGDRITMAANMPAVGAGKWTLASGADVTIEDPASPTTGISGLVPGNYIFRWTITNGSCSDSSDVAINISSGASPAEAGDGQSLCLATSTTLNATAPAIGTGMWTQTNGRDTAAIVSPASNTTTINGLVPGEYVFTWSVTFSNCPVNTDSVRIIVYDNPSAANAGLHQTICASTTSFEAIAPAVGTGTWSQIDGPNTAVIADAASPVSLVSSLIPGTYTFKWTITNGPCATTQDTVEINVSPIATIADAGDDQTVCALESITLSGNIPQAGTGLWSTVTGPNTPSFTEAENNATGVTGLIPGAYTFRWTITSGVCPPSTDEVDIIILDSLQHSITPLSDTICAGQPVTIVGTIPSGGNGTYRYQWEQSSNGIVWTDIVGETNKDLVLILNATTYFRRKVFSPPCENFSNVIEITVQPGISNNVISSDDSICINTQAPTITGAIPQGGDGMYFYQWQQSADGIAWNDIPQATGANYDPGVLVSTMQFRRRVSTLLCSGEQSNISNTVVITVNPDSRAEFTSNPLISCAPFVLDSSISITAYPDRNLLYNWYANDTLFGSNATGIFPGYTINDPGDTVVIKLVTTSRFGCLPDSIEQQFISVTTAVAAFTKDAAGGCGPLNVNFSNTSAAVNNSTQFFWDFGNGMTSTAAQPAAITFVQSPFYNDTTYQVTLQAYNGCDTTIWRDSVRVRSNPRARFGADTTAGCSPFTLRLTNNSLGGPNTYYWDFGNGHKDTTLVNGLLTYTYNIGNRVDTLPVQLVAQNECASDTQIITIRIAPNVIQPQITVNANDLFGCTPHTVAFVNATRGATSFTWDFDDNTAPVITNEGQLVVTHIFETPGVFTVTIRMTNGCSDTTAYRQVTVYARPVAAFTTAPAYCLGDTVTLNNGSANASNYTVFWGDGESSTAFSHVYTTPGNYTIVLRAEKTDSTGIVCSDSRAQSITVMAKPDVTVQSNIHTLNCAPFTLQATAPGITNETVTWYIADTAVSPLPVIITGANAQYTFNKPGTFLVRMIAENALGCRDSAIMPVTLRGTPAASFTPSAIAVCNTDTTVSYLNTTTFNDHGPISFRWLVDGALQSTGGNFTFRYVNPANVILPRTFSTQLIATNVIGCSDTATALLQMNPKPQALFSIANANACVPLTLSLNNASQYSSSYTWLINGNRADTGANPTLQITQASTPYTITLITDNIYGCGSDTFSVTFTSRIRPQAAFTLNDTLGCSGSLNVATANQSRNANSYQWDWGDASPGSSSVNPPHLFTATGRYTITLIASDGVCKDTADRMVTVATKPIVNFAADDTLTCDTARIQFTNLTVNATRYLWSFSDGTFSTATDPVKSFAPSPARYSVKLTAYSNAGCSDSLTRPNLILAQVPPRADFQISPAPIISVPDYTFTFNNLTPNSNLYRYQWNLGDGAFASTRDVTHKYADTGSYRVRLIVLDTGTGCADTTIKIAGIEGNPGYLYVPNAFYPNSLRNEFKTFKPLGKGLAEYHLQIFDSWGKLLFETRELDAAGSPAVGWNGATKEGTPMPQDAYAWRIRAKFLSGKIWDGMQYNNRQAGRPGNTFGTVTLFR